MERHDEDLVRSIDAVRSAVRRQNGRESPIGPRAQRTRDRLIAQADELFCSNGYNAVSAGDIAAAVGVAEPTFYQYFSGRAGVFMAVAGEHAIAMIASGVRDWDPDAGAEGFRQFIENYVSLYLADAPFFRIWEEATSSDASVGALRREFFGSFKRRIASAIRRGRDSGVLAVDVDVEELARAVAIGIENYLYDAVIFDPKTSVPQRDELVETLFGVWSAALGFNRTG
jgi:AcrR family transcriptional regulator